jgi:hypothetical protein
VADSFVVPFARPAIVLLLCDWKQIAVEAAAGLT